MEAKARNKHSDSTNGLFCAAIRKPQRHDKNFVTDKSAPVFIDNLGNSSVFFS
jgi:hypothetical protein